MAKRNDSDRLKNLRPNRPEPTRSKNPEDIEKLAREIDAKLGGGTQEEVRPVKSGKANRVSVRLPDQLIRLTNEEMNRTGRSRTHIIMDALWKRYKEDE